MMGARQALELPNVLASAESLWDVELSRLRRDVSTDPHDRDYRIACLIFPNEFASRDIRVRVFDIDAVRRVDPRLMVNFFIPECVPRGTGIALDLKPTSAI